MEGLPDDSLPPMGASCFGSPHEPASPVRGLEDPPESWGGGGEGQQASLLGTGAEL